MSCCTALKSYSIVFCSNLLLLLHLASLTVYVSVEFFNCLHSHSVVLIYFFFFFSYFKKKKKKKKKKQKPPSCFSNDESFIF